MLTLACLFSLFLICVPAPPWPWGASLLQAFSRGTLAIACFMGPVAVVLVSVGSFAQGALCGEVCIIFLMLHIWVADSPLLLNWKEFDRARASWGRVKR
jgi:hypothetical protein